MHGYALYLQKSLGGLWFPSLPLDKPWVTAVGWGWSKWDITVITVPVDSRDKRIPGLVNIQKAIENGHLQWVFLLRMVIFHSYVSLPEDIHSGFSIALAYSPQLVQIFVISQQF